MNRLTNRAAFRVSALYGFLGVALGAFGAHALKVTLARLGTSALWETAVLYHLVHAVAMLVVAVVQPLPRSTWLLFGVGVLAFSGSLYAYALTHVFWLNLVTPLGGLCFLAGWFLLGLRPPFPPAGHPDPS